MDDTMRGRCAVWTELCKLRVREVLVYIWDGERALFEPKYETATSRQPDHNGTLEFYSKPDAQDPSSPARLSCIHEILIVNRQNCPASNPSQFCV